jgi:hypothetical protein
VASLAPDIWYVVYYDPDAPLKAVEVKFGAGQKMDVRRPTRLLEPITKADEPLLREKLKIDSNEALKIASQQPLLEKLTLKASQLYLERHNVDDATPVWKVKLWAAKLKNPNDNVFVGERGGRQGVEKRAGLVPRLSMKSRTSTSTASMPAARMAVMPRSVSS